MGLSFIERLEWKEIVLWLVVTVVLGGMIYSSSTQAPFVLDDIHSIVQNEARRSIDWSMNNWLGTRSIPYFTLDLNYRWSELNVTGYHLVSIALHLVVTILITCLAYLVARASFKAEVWNFGWLYIDYHWLLGITVGLLFLVHPIQTQSVNYIVQRMVLIATLFYVISLLGYWLWREAKSKAKWGWAAVSLVAAVLAMHSKEIAITLPVAIVVMEYVFFSRNLKGLVRRWYKLLPWVLTIVIIPAYMMEVRDLFIQGEGLPPQAVEDTIVDKISWHRAVSVSAETDNISRSVYLMTQFGVIVRYMRLIIWPVGLNIDHDVLWQENWLATGVWLPGLIIIAVWVLAIRLFYKGYRVGAVGIALFFLALSVESSVIPIRDAIFEHRLYLPMVGVSLVMLELLNWVKERLGFLVEAERTARIVLVTAVVVLIVTLGVMSYARNGVWNSALSMWSDAVAKSPTKPWPLNNLGLAYADLKKYDEAEGVYQKALERDPENVEVLTNLGVLYGQTRRTAKATAVLRRSIEINPNNISGYVNLGNVLMIKQNWVGAEEMYRMALQKKESNFSVWASVGDALIEQKRINEAIDAYEKALSIERRNANWMNRLGALYAMQGRFEEAEEMLLKALAVDSELEIARDNLNRVRRDKNK